MSADEYRLEVFSAAERPERVRACQSLRYQIYHHDMGLDTPDMDHQAHLDIEDNDPVCDFLAVVRSDGATVGTLRLQTSGQVPFYAEKEFVLEGPFWPAHRLVEGARFAVLPELRHGQVPLMLFAGFRAYCRQRGVRHLLSVSIVRDAERRSERALSILGWLGQRVKLEPSRGRPAPGYEAGLSFRDGGAGPQFPGVELTTAADPTTLPAMVRMMAHARTTLCSVPAYCTRFGTWNFLLVTDVGAARARSSEAA